ncbi:MAG: molecular chaperone TorD family protein [Eggerthellaceae bacterium]|nr:molecular chaperone TorD family protein [Eggerthellaceae bacterium]
MLTVDNIRAYQALFSFCSWGFSAKPSFEELAGLARESDIFLENPFSTVAPESAELLHRLLSAADSAEAVEGLTREVHLDHAYLFYLVGSSKTSPYESVYRTDDCTMFGPTTLQVREAYARHGLAFERSSSEPDDHVGLEFAFVAHLLEKSACASSASEGLEAVRDFLSNHLLVFAPLYFHNVSVRANCDFYRSLAGIASGSLSALAEALRAEPVEAPDERHRLAE